MNNKKWKMTRVNYKCMECGNEYSHTEKLSVDEVELLKDCTPTWVLDCTNCNTNKWVEMISYKILE